MFPSSLVWPDMSNINPHYPRGEIAASWVRFATRLCLLFGGLMAAVLHGLIGASSTETSFHNRDYQQTTSPTWMTPRRNIHSDCFPRCVDRRAVGGIYILKYRRLATRILELEAPQPSCSSSANDIFENSGIFSTLGPSCLLCPRLPLRRQLSPPLPLALAPLACPPGKCICYATRTKLSRLTLQKDTGTAASPLAHGPARPT